MRELGGHATVLCELGYSLLERAGVWFDRLSGLRVGVVHAGPTAVDLPAVPRILGLSGPVLSTTDEPRLFSARAPRRAAHPGRRGRPRAGPGRRRRLRRLGRRRVGLCLGRADKAGTEDWVMAALLSGVAVGHGDPDAVTTLAATRAGFPHLRPEGGAADLPRALAEVGGGTGSVLLVERARGALRRPGRRPDRAAVDVRPDPAVPRALRPLRDGGRGPRRGHRRRGWSTRPTSSRSRWTPRARPSFEHRVAVPVTDVADVVSRLRSFAAGDRRGVSSGSLEDGAPTGVVFVFPAVGRAARPRRRPPVRDRAHVPRRAQPLRSDRAAPPAARDLVRVVPVARPRVRDRRPRLREPG
jgi:hypothetical protein